MSRISLSPGEVQALYNKLETIESMVKNEIKRVEDPILTTEQLMNLLDVSRRTVQTWRDQGIIQFSAVQNKFFYRLSHVYKMLDTYQK